MSEPVLTSLQETADRLDEIMEVSSPWVHAKLTPMLRDAADVIEGLEHENAKLRELVRDVYKAAHMLCEAWEGSCNKEADSLSLHAACPIGDIRELCVFGKLDDRVRELGIEV